MKNVIRARTIQAVVSVTLASFALACGGDSPTEPGDSPTEPESTTTTIGGFELTVERGTRAEWTHRVTLTAGNWISAKFVSCDEMRAITLRVGPCESATVRLEAGDMTFSGTVGGQFTDKIRVRWEATAR